MILKPKTVYLKTTELARVFYIINQLGFIYIQSQSDEKINCTLSEWIETVIIFVCLAASYQAKSDYAAVAIASTGLWHCWVVECSKRKTNWCSEIMRWSFNIGTKRFKISFSTIFEREQSRLIGRSEERCFRFSKFSDHNDD